MIWDAVRYGWSPVYYLTIEGIPVIWTETALGLTLPTGYTTEAAALSLEAAAIGTEQIDRQRGVAMTAPLGFKLLDNATTRAYLSRWDLETRITATADYGDATIAVDDTTGWGVPGSLHIGRELVTYTGKGANSFTGCTRGVCGLAYTHRVGTSGQTITDKPRYWLGRQVTLWAKPCDASGAVPGAALATDAVEVWRGRISGMPARHRDGFAFQAEQLDRLLDAPLAGKISGTVKGTGGYYAVNLADQAVIGISLMDAAAVYTDYSATLYIWTGSGKTQGQAVTGADVRAQVVTAWSNWVTGNNLAAVFGALTWWKSTLNGLWTASILVKANVLIEGIEVWTDVPVKGSAIPAIMPSGMSGDMNCGTGWEAVESPMDPGGASVGIIAELDDALAADVVAPGLLRVTVGKQLFQFAYDFVVDSGANVYFGTTGKSAFPFKLAGVVGASCYIAQDSNGTTAELMLRALETSGAPGLRGTFDTLQQGLGYGIDSTLLTEADFASDPTVQFDGIYEPDGRAFAEVFGGVLALYRRAVVGRVDAGAWTLRLVSTDPGGTDNADTLADSDLLAHAGDPVESFERALAPNSVTIRITSADAEIVQIYNANADIEATGRREVEYPISATTPSDVTDSTAALVLGLFAADQMAQAVKLRVGPWVAAQPGDVVYLDGLTHPALWDWVTGAQGYSGTGRVVGRMFDPVTLAVSLVVLIAGGVTVSSLCPSAEVLGYDGTAANPISITIAGTYLTVMQVAVPCSVMHYQPGQTEATTTGYTIASVAKVAGQCVLTVGGIFGAPVLSTGASYLTWPTSATDTAFQARFSHAADGTSWG